ncbi:MAG: 50S ribosomal protein L3 [Bdellovibrionota bacterium]
MTTKRVYQDGLLGKKIGMTQIFDEQGQCIPVTLVEAGPCYVLGIKSEEKNGYQAVEFGYQAKKTQRVNKPLMGHFAKAKKGAFKYVKELRFSKGSKLADLTIGAEISAKDIFSQGVFVDITGISKGKGFAGVMKRYNYKGQAATHGTHEHRRNIGSIGSRTSLGNRNMPGRMGCETVTTQNLKVVAVDEDKNLIMVKGAVPGPKGGMVIIKNAVKKSSKKRAA